MPALAAIILNDGQATPVAHTFDPVKIDSVGVAKWNDAVGGIPVGFPYVTFLNRSPSKDGSVYKITAKIVLPVLEVTSPSTATGIQPAPTKAYDLTATIDVILPQRSSLAERKNLNAYMKNFLANTVMTQAVESLATVY